MRVEDAASAPPPGPSGSSMREVRHHYDVGNDFYRVWLDELLTYSCALWQPGDSLDAAQRRKLDFHAEGARARGARRVLDVGCGWGGMLQRLVEKYEVEHAVGLTLSAAQAEWIRGRGDPRQEVRVEHWVDHAPAQPYDAIVSIGAFEHFASLGQRRKEKVAAYRQYFQRCHDLLRPGSRMTLQTMVKGEVPLDREGAHEMAWLYTEMFPGMEVPRFAEVAEASERLFEWEAVRCDRLHYAQTLDAWLERLSTRRAEAVAAAGEAMVTKYERYLALSAKQFRVGWCSLVRIVLARV
jgi:cyclopropane-fatty-acyl-phospholipid synthase